MSPPRLLHCEDGNARCLNQRFQLFRVYRVAGRVANDDHRTLGIGQQGCRFLYKARIALGSSHVPVLLGQVWGQFFL